MGLTIDLFAGPSDSRGLSEHIFSLGLRMYPILLSQREISLDDDPAEYPYCFISPLCREQLHPYGNPPRIGAATDPLIQMMRPYFRKPDLLVIGDLHCSDDVSSLFQVTNPIFQKLSKWVSSNWYKLPAGGYIGPEARRLLELGVRLSYLPPDATIERRVI